MNLQPLLFWVREKSGSNAEVDFLLPTPRMIPVEVKSGATGHLRSLLLYMDKTDVSLAVRLYSSLLLCREGTGIWCRGK